MRRIGVMGGTFDPIHHGHLIAAEEARVGFALDRVLFVPAGRPWQKDPDEVSDALDRHEMAVLATRDNPSFGVSRLEIDRDGPTYTVDTLRTLRDGCASDAELYFITGADAILSILTWKDPSEVLSLATFIAVTRPGVDMAAGLSSDVRDRVRVLEIPGLAVSSTDIRGRVRAGRSIRYLVPDTVRDYIEDRGLYR